MRLSSVKRWFLYCCLLVSSATILIIINNDLFTVIHPSRWLDRGATFYYSIPNDTRCRIPILDPFVPEVMELLKEPCKYKHYCEAVPKLFESPLTLDSLLVPLIPKEDFTKLGISSCCYRVVKSTPYNNNYSLSNTCHPLSLSAVNKLPPDIEFAAVYCTLFTKTPLQFNYSYFKKRTLDTPILVDIHYFVNLKPDVEKRLGNKSLPPSEDRLNVLIIGIDSVTRSQMIRAMPLTYNFLVHELQAVEMKGYNKVGYNTFPCVTPLFFHMEDEEVLSTCVNQSGGYFDSCPFIWNHFAAKGFRTSFHEQWLTAGIFSYDTEERHGFRSQPVDYFSYGPVALHLKEGGGAGRNQFCNGPRHFDEHMVDYTKKFVMRMATENKSYFHFIWLSKITHNYLACYAMEDFVLWDLFKWLRGEGHLSNTVLLLISDHGFFFVGHDARGLGGYSVESQLPNMFFVFPESFKRKHSKAYKNLEANSVYRLTTLYDLHRTLLDILEPERIETNQLLRREKELKEQELNSSLPKGISHFLPIPKSRVCDDAAIPARYCACIGTWEDVSLKHELVSQGAEFAVQEMNKLLEDHLNSCFNLTLSKILSAKQMIVPGMKLESKRTTFLLQIETEPGAGTFEVQVFHDAKYVTKWKVWKEFARLDQYSTKGHGKCVPGTIIEKYCVCK